MPYLAFGRCALYSISASNEGSTPGEDFDRAVGDVELHPVAVELDLMYPAFAARHTLSIEVAKAGSMKSGIGALVPIAIGFLR